MPTVVPRQGPGPVGGRALIHEEPYWNGRTYSPLPAERFAYFRQNVIGRAVRYRFSVSSLSGQIPALVQIIARTERGFSGVRRTVRNNLTAWFDRVNQLDRLSRIGLLR